jgi:hypothetical protein
LAEPAGSIGYHRTTAIGAEQSKMGRATDTWRCPEAAIAAVQSYREVGRGFGSMSMSSGGYAKGSSGCATRPKVREIGSTEYAGATQHSVPTNPVYAGAYAYGKSRHERYLDPHGKLKQRVRHLPRTEWSVLLPDHHQGFIDWPTYEANQARLAANTHPTPHRSGGP